MIQMKRLQLMKKVVVGVYTRSTDVYLGNICIKRCQNKIQYIEVLMRCSFGSVFTTDPAVLIRKPAKRFFSNNFQCGYHNEVKHQITKFHTQSFHLQRTIYVYCFEHYSCNRSSFYVSHGEIEVKKRMLVKKHLSVHLFL